MKKVKVLLTAITVFAVVGGALAFKAQTFGLSRYYTKGVNGGTTCSVSISAKEVPDTQAGFLTSASINPGACDELFITTIE